MSTVPTAAFADRLQSLDRQQRRSFVAELWSLAGWKTIIEGETVVCRRNGREQRLLVLPAGRLARFRYEPPPTDEIDRVVSPRVEDEETIELRDSEVTLDDADDLRHRLVYGCDSADAARLWRAYFDVPMRDPSWDHSRDRWLWAHAALGATSLLLVVGAVAIMVFGLPFLGAEEPSAASVEGLDSGLDREIAVEPASFESQQPSGIPWGPTVYVGTEPGTVGALDGETGDPLWTTKLDRQLHTPLVVDGTVYVRAASGVYALDALTGEQQWRYTNTTGNSTHYDIRYSTSTRLSVVNGSVYFGDGEKLVALNRSTGEQRWRVSASTTLAGAPTVLDGVVYIGGLDGVIGAYDVTDGEQVWEKAFENESFYSSGVPYVDGENVSLLVAGRASLYAFDSETGEVGWQFESVVSGGLSPPVVFNASASSVGTETMTNESLVYVAGDRSFLYGLTPSTGEKQVTYRDEAAEFQPPVVGNESGVSVYVVGRSPIKRAASTVTALNASTGEKRWLVRDQNQTLSAPTTVDERLYLGTDEGEVLALETGNGTRQWRVDAFAGAVSGAPTVVTDPVDGDSVDSRVRLGVKGHHDWLTGQERNTADGESGISVVDTNVSGTVAAKERVDVRLTLVNDGTEQENTTVAVDPGWEISEGAPQATVELDPGDGRDVVVSFGAPNETGRYESVLTVGGERHNHTTTVVDRPTHEVTGLDSPDTVWTDSGTDVIASLNNTGNVTATTPVALAFGGEVVDSTERTVGPNETVSVTLTLDPTGVPTGDYNYTVATGDSVRSERIEVLSVDRREDALPIVSQVFGVTLLISGLALGWRAVTDIRVSLRARRDAPGES